MFIEQLDQNPEYFFSWVGFAILSICIHESAHARMAVYFGDDTPKDYVPLNPMKQMGWLSLLILCFLGVAWGAVPVNPAGLRSRTKNALVYLAGPLANFGLCAIFALLAQTARLWGAPQVEHILFYGSYVNGALCLLNLVPIPPLDGFGFIRSLMSMSLETANMLNRFGLVCLIVLWSTPAVSYIFGGGAKLAELFFALWIMPFQLFN